MYVTVDRVGLLSEDRKVPLTARLLSVFGTKLVPVIVTRGLPFESSTVTKLPVVQLPCTAATSMHSTTASSCTCMRMHAREGENDRELEEGDRKRKEDEDESNDEEDMPDRTAVVVARGVWSWKLRRKEQLAPKPERRLDQRLLTSARDVGASCSNRRKARRSSQATPRKKFLRVRPSSTLSWC